MGKTVEQFREYRAKMNEKILAADNRVIKRIYNLDTNTYRDGALSATVKEMLGLATSMVLRCDDCIKYHLERCHELKVTTEQLFEIFAVADLVGGTIVIPHMRRALEYWEELGEYVSENSGER
ncbi:MULTISPECIES: carboxymuconolactone decarboxylase family protein [Sanguibacteroides]|uniref:Alkylhydroperoxidase n=1 Tax=Sanguibacteroides justesenii TaxID=1547597 RepID=A0A0C3MC16_9PORP|nr:MULTISPECIES: carboxymuconolactone decarboxylase family protein [Sanguibacteroides]KIO43963.1 alkylhydroperoxidase [Sanguibacteroides justesenii]PXZ44001.1 carboxymuconolactone decarboxylase family protein [Sanguibacteroides justesenii]